MRDKDLEQKVMVVTGGSRGIGREIVLGAISRGARVAFCARQIGRNGQAVKEQAESYGNPGQVIAFRADVSKEEDVEALFDATLDAFGKVDVVINNAGISRASLLMQMTTQDWDDVIGTNLTGAFLVARRAVKEFLAQGEGGRIISVGSVTQNGAPSNASYAASKGGLVGLTRSIAAEYGDQGISTSLVVGGYADTRLLADVPDLRARVIEACPQKRLASPKEIASVVLFLASDEAACMSNGEAMFVSGGLVDPPVK